MDRVKLGIDGRQRGASALFTHPMRTRGKQRRDLNFSARADVSKRGEAEEKGISNRSRC